MNVAKKVLVFGANVLGFIGLLVVAAAEEIELRRKR